MTDWLSAATNLPAEYLKAAGTVLGGACLALGTYVVARIKEVRRPPESVATLPRVALDPVALDLAFTLARTGTDLTRALHDHGEILRRTIRGDDDGDGGNGGGAAPPRSQRSHRNRRPHA
jgi:hypothetical protein